MLHCASTAKVVRPLAFVAGVLPDAAVGWGVAQIQGWVCEPSSTGPPIGWFVITRRASRPPWPSPAAKSLRPSTRPLTTPRSVRAAALAVNAPVTSWPLSDSRTLFSATLFGTRTSSSASPPLMRSARFDSDTISKLDRPSPACAVARSSAPNARNDDFMQFMVGSSLLGLQPPGDTLRQRLLHPFRRETQRAQALAGRVGDGIGDRRGGRALRAFAHAEETLFGAVEQHHLDLRRVLEEIGRASCRERV